MLATGLASADPPFYTAVPHPETTLPTSPDETAKPGIHMKYEAPG